MQTYLNNKEIILIALCYYIYYLCMSKKSTRSNILFIASDDSDHDSSGQQDKKQKIIKTNAAKPKFGLFGSHRLNNQTISKGFFHNHGHEQEYQFQAQKCTKKLAQSNEINRRQHEKFFKDNHAGQNQKTRDETVNKDKIKHVQTQKKLQPVPLGIAPPKTLRSKTLLFQFDQSQQSNEIQNQQQQQTNVFQQPKPKQAKFFAEKTKQTEKQYNQPIQKEQTSITNCNMHRLLKSNKLSFADCRITKGCKIQGKIIKKNQLSNLLYSQFDVNLRSDLTHLISCKKFFGSVGSNYRISIEDEDFTYLNNNVIGKVRSSTNNYIYNVYDSGISSQKFEPKKYPKTALRQILATIRIHISDGPRSMEVYVLKEGKNYNQLMGVSLSKQISLQSLYNVKQNQEHILLYKTRKPEWVPQFKQYFMNFGNRVNQSSIRNFILEDPITREQVLFFGKSQNNVYHIDISYPLTLRLGFAIAIPQLDRDD